MRNLQGYLQNSINTVVEFSDCPHEELIDFCSEFCRECEDFLDIKERLSALEIKNNPRSKIAKSTLQLYAYVYQKIIGFPRSKFDYETLTTSDLFIFVHKIINVKIHLHHSHITGKIFGYARDFCNEKVRENREAFSLITFLASIYIFLSRVSRCRCGIPKKLT